MADVPITHLNIKYGVGKHVINETIIITLIKFCYIKINIMYYLNTAGKIQYQNTLIVTLLVGESGYI